MKKISLITLHRVKNYGSVLQAFATQVILNKYGYEVEVIDYYPSRYSFCGMLRRIKSQKKYLRKSFILRNLARIIIIPSYILRFRVFNKFIHEFLKLSPKVYKNGETIKN